MVIQGLELASRGHERALLLMDDHRRDGPREGSG